jgi:GNAT superfamily N-acetyltransferase
MASEWGGRVQVRRGEAVDVLAFAGLVAGDRAGMLTYALGDDGEGEILWLNAVHRFGGVGTALVDALPPARRWVVTTTNDNVDALRFYQRRGFRFLEVRVGAVDAARSTLKPAIPLVGDHGIELHDEIELFRRS